MDVERIIQQEDVKEKVSALLRSVKRDGVDELISHLENVGYFLAPASTQHHLCYEGGLAEHSLNVYNSLLSIALSLDYEKFGITHDNLVITALLHDLGKSSFNGKAEYIDNILKSGKRSESKPYEKNKERQPIAHEIISLLSLGKVFELEEEEITAILYHNGSYTNLWRDIQNKERPLQLILHYADLWVSRFVESKGLESEE